MWLAGSESQKALRFDGGPDPGSSCSAGSQSIGCERFHEGARDFVVNFRSPVKIDRIADDKFRPAVGKLQPLLGNRRFDGDVQLSVESAALPCGSLAVLLVDGVHR